MLIMISVIIVSSVVGGIIGWSIGWLSGSGSTKAFLLKRLDEQAKEIARLKLMSRLERDAAVRVTDDLNANVWKSSASHHAN